MIATKELLTAAALCALFCVCGLECSAEAQPARVEAGQVCAVKRALRNGHWLPKMCERVARGFNETRDPVLFAAIWTLESGMNEKAIKVVRPGVYDLGGAQVRCVTLGAVAESTGDSSANSEATTTTTIPRDRCTNGAARGLYAHQLLDPSTNIRTATAVLESHGGNLNGYNGCVEKRGRRCDYDARIMALVAAFGGELRIPKGAYGRKWERVRELARRIVGAINQERKS